MPNPGWECPRCGACYAPFVMACARCQPSGLATNTTPAQRCLHDWSGPDTAGHYCRKCGERSINVI